MKGTRSSIVPRGVDRARAEGAKERSVLWVFRGLKGARGCTVEQENLRKAPGKAKNRSASVGSASTASTWSPCLRPYCCGEEQLANTLSLTHSLARHTPHETLPVLPPVRISHSARNGLLPILELAIYDVCVLACLRLSMKRRDVSGRQARCHHQKPQNVLLRE